MNEKKKNSRLAIGILLIALGAIYLIAQIIPGTRDWLQLEFTWPLIIVGVGVFLLILGLATGEPDLAVPACIVGGIGLILYWQNANDRYDTWAYAWALIPGFVGVGVLLSGLLKGQFRQAIREGGGLIVVSTFLFLIFGSFFGGLELLGDYWPVLLILLGLWIILQAFVGRKSKI